jgi:hypothetical protein
MCTSCYGFCLRNKINDRNERLKTIGDFFTPFRPQGPLFQRRGQRERFFSLRNLIACTASPDIAIIGGQLND